MALNQGTTYVRLEGDLTPLQRDLKSAEVMTTKTGSRVESRFKKVGSSIASSLGAAAKRGVQAAGIATVAWAGYSIKAASDVGESVNKATAIFGNGIDKVLEWSETTANAFGISQAEALETSASFGAMLDTAGVTGDAMTDMSIRLVELAADMGSFNNQDPSEMLDRLRSGLAGEAEPLRRFGVFISEAAIQTQALKDGLIEQGEEMTEAQKVQARYNLILAQTTKQHGDFGRTSDAMPNQIRRLKASFADVSAELGEKLLPVAVAVLEWLNDKLPGAIEFAGNAVRGMAAVWKFLVRTVGDAFSRILDILATFIDFWFNAAGKILSAADFAFGWLPGIGDDIGKLRDKFNNSTDSIISDMRAAAREMDRWGNKSSANVTKITEAVGGLTGLFGAIPDEIKVSGGTGDGFGTVSGPGGTPTNMFQALAHAVPGAQVITSGYRPGAITSSGNPSLHGIAPPWNAVDVGGENLLAFAQMAAASYGNRLRELIYTPLGFSIKNGQRVAPIAASDHYDHVHLADMGAIVRGPAMIAQGNITEAHIPLTGPGAKGMFLTGILEIPGLGKAILKGAHLTFDQRNHQDARSGRWQASVAT